jgi:hypothetical protein
MEGHVTCMRERRGVHKNLGETRGKETTLKTQAVDGRIILKWIFKKRGHGMD